MKNIILFLLFFAAFTGWSQDLTYVIGGKLTNMDNGLSEGGVTVTMLRDGNVVGTTKTASNGKYNLKVSGPKSGKYEIVYSKPGMVTKKISFDGSMLNEEDLPAGNEIPFPTLDLDLFAEREGLDFSFLESEYVASFFWNEKKFTLDFDKVASEKVRKKIEKLLLDADKAKAELEAKYAAAIKAADLGYSQKKYEDALKKYEEASTLKPNEKYPAEKIVELEALIKAQKDAANAAAQSDAEYNNLITAADNFRDQNEYQKAIDKYQEALQKKNEQYPKDQIATLKKKIEDLKKEAENQAKYDAAIKLADDFFAKNDLTQAKIKYTEASQFKPSESYPKEKLKEVEAKMKADADAAATKKKYDDAIAAADGLFKANNFEGAKAKYTEASGIMPNEEYPKTKIAECIQKINEANAAKDKAAKIAESLKKGNDALNKTEYEQAKTHFQDVLTIDDSNKEAKDKIALIEQKLKELNDKAALEEKFNALVSEGDNAMNSENFLGAIAKYEEAKTLKTTPELDTKLKTAKAKQAEYLANKEKTDKYNSLMTEASNLLSSDKLDQARIKYQEALKIDPSKSEPKDKIKDIDDKLAVIAQDAAKKVKYDKAIADADALFKNNQLIEAQVKYNEALSIDPSQSYPSDRISEITKLIETKKIEEEKKAKIALLLKDANALYALKKYEDAKSKYQEVLAIDPTNSEADKQIQAINNQLASEKSEAEKEAAFTKLRDEGYALADAKEYIAAKQKLQEALSLKNDPLITKKIAEIESLIVSENAQKEIDEKYNKLISEADGLESSGNLQKSVSLYREAAKLKPTEKLPKDKIAELELAMAKNSAQAEIDKKYNEHMSKGDQYMDAKNYLEAIKEYNKALTLKPEETEPSQKAAEAENLERQKTNDADIQYEKILTVAREKIDVGEYDKALELIERAKKNRPSDKRPNELEKEVIALKQKEIEYNNLISKADVLASSKKYQDAKDTYQKALLLKPKESLPVEKIAEMDRLLAEGTSAAQKEQLYKDYMSKGSTELTKKNYDQALIQFQNALSVKPSDKDAQTKIEEIQNILNSINNVAQQEIEKKNKIDQLIKEADDLFAADELIAAKEKYNEVLNLDPGNSYVKRKINEVVKREMEIAKQDVNKEYKKIIDKGDEYFNQASYDKAKEYYERAIGLRATDPYPKKKLDEIDAILNPKIVESAELKPLGLPFEDNSILDGQALLESAQMERETAKGTKVGEQLDIAADQNAERSKAKTNELYETDNEIFLIQEKVGKQTEESDLNRQAIIEALRASELSFADQDFQNAEFEAADTRNSQDMLDVIQVEAQKEYAKNVIDQQVNTELLRMVTKDEEEKITELTSERYDVTLNSQDQLYVINKQVQENAVEQSLAAQENSELIKAVERAENNAKTEQLESKSKSLLTNQDELDYINKNSQEHTEEQINAYRENTELVKDVQKKENDALIGKNEVKNEALLKGQDELYDIKSKAEAENTEKIQVYAENAEFLDVKQDALAELESVKTGANQTKTIEADQQLIQKKLLIDQNVRDDSAERAEVNNELVKTEKHIEDAEMVRNEAKHEQLLENKSQVHEMKTYAEIDLSQRSTEAAENNEELKSMEKLLNDAKTVQTQAEIDQNLSSDKAMHDAKEMIIEDNEGREDHRFEAHEELKLTNQQISDASFEKTNAELEKYATNKQILNKETAENAEINEAAELAHSKNVEGLKIIDKKATINDGVIQGSDEEERLNARKSVENIQEDAESHASTDAEKVKENAASMSNVTKDLADAQNDQAEGQQDKHYENQQILNKVDNTKKPQEKVANSLGSEYPEGVSQESFQQVDQNGLMTAIITRRVVVINGHADVYVRTQTLNAITYSKNGKPTTQYVWSKETADPKLERHY